MPAKNQNAGKAPRKTKTKKKPTVADLLAKLENTYPGLSGDSRMVELLEIMKPPPPPPADPTWGKEEMRRCITNMYTLKDNGDTLSRKARIDPITKKSIRVRGDSLGTVVYKPNDENSTVIKLVACWKCLNSRVQRYVEFVIL